MWLGQLIIVETAICQWQEAQVALGFCVLLDHGVLWVSSMSLHLLFNFFDAMNKNTEDFVD